MTVLQRISIQRFKRQNGAPCERHLSLSPTIMCRRLTLPEPTVSLCRHGGCLSDGPEFLNERDCYGSGSQSVVAHLAMFTHFDDTCIAQLYEMLRESRL